MPAETLSTLFGPLAPLLPLDERTPLGDIAAAFVELGKGGLRRTNRVFWKLTVLKQFHPERGQR